MKKLTTLILGISLGVSALSANNQISYEELRINQLKSEITKNINCPEKLDFSISKIQRDKRQVLGVCKSLLKLNTKELDMSTKAYLIGSMEHDMKNAIALKELEGNKTK